MEQSSDEFLSTWKRTYEESEPILATQTFCFMLFASRSSSISNTTCEFVKWYKQFCRQDDAFLTTLIYTSSIRQINVVFAGS